MRMAAIFKQLGQQATECLRLVGTSLEQVEKLGILAEEFLDGEHRISDRTRSVRLAAQLRGKMIFAESCSRRKRPSDLLFTASSRVGGRESQNSLFVQRS